MELPVSRFQLAVAAAMAFGAGFTRGVTGFGMAPPPPPMIGLLLPPADAVLIGILVQLFIGPVGFRKIAADCEWNSALPIALLAMVATPLGMLLLRQTSPDVARIMIAMIAIAAFLLVIWPTKGAGGPAGKGSIAFTGIATGLLTGFAAMPGPPVVPFYMRRRVPPAVARASMMCIFFATAIAGSIGAWVMGIGTMALLLLALCLFPFAVAGNWIGGFAFGKVPEHIWRACVALVLGIAGISAIWRALS